MTFNPVFLMAKRKSKSAGCWKKARGKAEIRKAGKKARGKQGTRKKEDSDFGREHYMRLEFSVLSNNLPEVYEFFYNYLPRILRELGDSEVGLKIERLEPLDEAHTNISFGSSLKFAKALSRFAKAHGMHREKNVLLAKVPVNRLKGVLKDYNLVFDMFFSDIQIASKRVHVEMMDGFSNRVLLKGKLSALTAFRSILHDLAKGPVKAEFADSLEAVA